MGWFLKLKPPAGGNGSGEDNRFKNAEDPLAVLWGYAPLERDKLNAAIRLSDDERSRLVMELTEGEHADRFYALVASIMLLNSEDKNCMANLVVAIQTARQAATKATELREKLLIKERRERLGVVGRAMYRIGYRKNGKMPWAGITTGYTRAQLQEIEKRAREIGGVLQEE